MREEQESWKNLIYSEEVLINYLADSVCMKIPGMKGIAELQKKEKKIFFINYSSNFTKTVNVWILLILLKGIRVILNYYKQYHRPANSTATRSTEF